MYYCSIIVDFTIEDSDDDENDDQGLSSCVECVKNLKKQLMDPSSALFKGAITRDCLKLISDIEIYQVVDESSTQEDEERESDHGSVR